MSYQAKAPKKVYFAAGYKRGFEDALDPFWVSCSRCGNEEMVTAPFVCTGENVDGAWDDYCDFWRQKAIEEGKCGEEEECGEEIC